MSATTEYDVNLRYILQDQVSGGLAGIRDRARETAAASTSLSDSLGRLAGIAGGLFGVHEAKKALVDFNSEMEQAKITATGLLQLNAGGTFSDNMARATEVVSRLQQEAKTSVGTTADMVHMFSMLAQPLSQAGASMEDYVNITKASVVASRAMGIAADVAARDVDQAIRGQFHSVDQFTGKVLGPMGFVGEEGRARFNALSQTERLNTLRKGLAQPAFKDMAAAQGTSFAGEVSTLQDNIQIALGKVGLPLFKEITAEIHEWNQWIEKNGEALDEMGTKFGKSIVEGFRVLKDVASFFVEHREMILRLAEVWAGLKIAGGVSGGIGSVFGDVNSLRGAMGDLVGAKGIGGAMTGFAGLTGKLVSTTASLAALGVAAWELGSIIGNQIGEANTRREIAKVHADVLGPNLLKEVQMFQRMQQSGDWQLQLAAAEPFKKLVDQTLTKSGLAAGGKLDVEETARMFSQSRDLRQQFATALGVREMLRTASGDLYDAGHVTDDPEKIAQALAKYLDPILKDYRDGMKAIPPLGKPTNADKPKVNVTIQHIEVVSDDPDRFAFGLVAWARDAAKNPGQAKRTIREG